jgi:hypothetical protein
VGARISGRRGPTFNHSNADQPVNGTLTIVPMAEPIFTGT